MIAARIGPIGKLKLPSADAVVAEAVGSEVSCAAAVVSAAAGSPVVTLAATAARRTAPRDWRPPVAAAIRVTGCAAGPSPLPVDGRDTAAREEIPFTAPAGAGVDRATTDLLAAEAAGPEWEPRATDLRSAPRVADGEDAEATDLTFGPADSVDPVSAIAAGAAANSPPTPNATARAPTRPTYRAWLDAPRRPVDSVLRTRCAFTDHHLL